MPSIVERERQLQKVIDRWENEGGAIATSGRERRAAVPHIRIIGPELVASARSPTLEAPSPTINVVNNFHQLHPILISQISTNQDHRHKSGNHSKSERVNRITVQVVESDAARVVSRDLVDRQDHRRT